MGKLSKLTAKNPTGHYSLDLTKRMDREVRAT